MNKIEITVFLLAFFKGITMSNVHGSPNADEEVNKQGVWYVAYNLMLYLL